MSQSKPSNNRPPKRDLNGVLLFDKPRGLSSNKALQIVKGCYRAKKAGHAGSLDPLASGLLPIFFGEATKLSRFLLNSDKTYLVTAKLGVRTDSGDEDGEIISTRDLPVDISTLSISRELEKLTGNIAQIPPMFSAIKQNGQPLYKLARRGIEVERKARDITVHSIELLEFNQDLLSLKVHCSKGTYIRTIVDDLGELLGCGAHVIELRRIGVGSFAGINKFITLDEVKVLADYGDYAGLDYKLLPMTEALNDLPLLELCASSVFYIRNGQAVLVPNAPTEGWVGLSCANTSELIGVGEVLSDGRVAPRRLMQNSRHLNN